jgi:hypothetical protein
MILELHNCIFQFVTTYYVVPEIAKGSTHTSHRPIATTQPTTQNNLKQLLLGWYYYRLKKNTTPQPSMEGMTNC